jgi:hypothetical protein
MDRALPKDPIRLSITPRWEHALEAAIVNIEDLPELIEATSREVDEDDPFAD